MSEVASAYVTLIPSFKGGKAAIGKEIDGATADAGKRAGSKAGKGFGGSFIGGVGKFAGPLAAVFAAPVVLGGLNSLADKASDLNETVNKSTVIFGKNAKSIDQWAKGAAKSMGLSRQQALEAAAGFGDMFSQIGFSGDQATKMSKSVVQMSADLGSFNNLPTEDVAQRLSAAFRGEYDSLQALVPNINAARVEQQALAMSGKKTAKELTAQEKAAATLAIVQKDGARAMGDFARTSDGVANKAKIQSARLEDLKTRAGGVLLPIKSLAIDGFGALITGAEKLAPMFSRIGGAFKGLFDLFVKGDFTGGLAKSLGIEEDSKITDTLFNIRDGFLQAFGQIKTFVQTQVMPAFNGIMAAVRGFLAVAVPIVQAFVAGMMARIRPMMPQIRAIFAAIGQIIVGVMGLVRAVISRVTAVISYIWARWGKNIMDFVATAFRNVLTVIGGALKIIQGIIKVATSIFKGDWSGAWTGIKQIVSGAWQVIKGVVSGALNALGGIIKGSGALLGAAMSAVGDKINGALDGLRDKMLNAGKELIQNLIDGIKAKIGAVKDAAKNVAQAIKDFFPGSPVRRGPLTSWNNGGAGRRLGDQLASGLSASQSTVAAASRGLASSVAAPVGSPALAGVGAGGGSMSQADILRLAAAMGNVQLQTTVSAGSFDRQMGVRL